MEDRPIQRKKLNIITAALLTFFMVGLGQIASGRIRRGIALFVASQILFIGAAFIAIQPFPPLNIIIPALIFVSVFLFALIDSVIIAKNPDNTLKLKPLLGYSLMVALLVINASIIQPSIKNTIRESYIQAFKIPSGAMIPTLLVGDHLLADKHIYKTTEPKRGDIIIFPYPKEPSRDFVKRLIAVEGDIVEMRDKKLYLNGKAQEEPYIINNDSSVVKETRDNFGPLTVPPGELFFMGDNRDQSYDSRYYGYVKRDTIKGKAISLYWSWDRIAHKVRWDRIGKIIK